MRLGLGLDRRVVLVQRKHVAVQAGVAGRAGADVALALLALAEVVAGDVEDQPVVPRERTTNGTVQIRYGLVSTHSRRTSGGCNRRAYHSPHLGSERVGASGSVMTSVYSLPSSASHVTVGLLCTCEHQLRRGAGARKGRWRGKGRGRDREGQGEERAVARKGRGRTRTGASASWSVRAGGRTRGDAKRTIVGVRTLPCLTWCELYVTCQRGEKQQRR